MGIYSLVSEKIAKAKAKREEMMKNKFVSNTQKLEKAIKLRKELEKREAVRSMLAKEKTRIREIKTANIRGILSKLKSLKSKLPKNKGVYNPNTGVGGGKVWTGTGFEDVKPKQQSRYRF